MGDKGQWGDCAAMLGESAWIAGDMTYAIDMQLQLLEDARRRRNPLHQCWGLLGVAVNYTRTGKAEQAVPLLEEALQILDETPNIASSIETYGQLALAYLRLGQKQNALDAANKSLEISTGISPTVYSMNIGYTAIADVFFELWEESLQTTDLKPDSAKYQSLVEKSIKLLRGFQNVFPIGQPSTPYYQGWYEWLTGKQDAARKSWQKSIESSQKYNMPYEEALAMYRIGASLPKDDPSHSEYLTKAAAIFEKMNCVVELDWVKAVR